MLREGRCRYARCERSRWRWFGRPLSPGSDDLLEALIMNRESEAQGSFDSSGLG